MLGYVDAARDPNAFEGLDVFKETLQSHYAAGTSDQAAMQADVQHLRRTVQPFGIKRIKAVFEVFKELLPGVEPLRGCKTHIIGVESVRQDKLVPFATKAAERWTALAEGGNAARAALPPSERGAKALPYDPASDYDAWRRDHLSDAGLSLLSA